VERGPTLNPAVGLLSRVARDGHTGATLDLVELAAGSAALDAAVTAGEVVVEDGWVALEPLALAEASIADEILGLAAEGRISVVLETARTEHAADIGPFDDLRRMALADLAAALQAVPDDMPVVLRGDPDELLGAEAGAPLRDIVESGLVPVEDRRPAPDPEGPGLLDALPAAIRAGQLPDPRPHDRSVVVVPCEDDTEVVHRVQQLLNDSIPRVFGVAAPDVLVLTPLRRGTAGCEALASLLAETNVSTVHNAVGRSAEAVVVCLPGQAAGVLHRALIYSAVLTAGRHLSIVSAAGDAVPRAVADGSLRRRATRLGDLLRSGAAG